MILFLLGSYIFNQLRASWIRPTPLQSLNNLKNKPLLEIKKVLTTKPIQAVQTNP